MFRDGVNRCLQNKPPLNFLYLVYNTETSVGGTIRIYIRGVDTKPDGNLKIMKSASCIVISYPLSGRNESQWAISGCPRTLRASTCRLPRVFFLLGLRTELKLATGLDASPHQQRTPETPSDRFLTPKYYSETDSPPAGVANARRTVKSIVSEKNRTEP